MQWKDNWERGGHSCPVLMQEIEATGGDPGNQQCVVPASHFRNPFSGIHAPCGAKIWSSSQSQGTPKLRMNEWITLPRFQIKNTVGSGAGSGSTAQDTGNYLCHVCPTPPEIQQEQEGDLQSPLCTSKYICKWRITAHGSPTKQSRFRLEQCRRSAFYTPVTVCSALHTSTQII